MESVPEILDQFVRQGPVSHEELNAAVRRFKKAIIERALGGELTHHLGYRDRYKRRATMNTSLSRQSATGRHMPWSRYSTAGGRVRSKVALQLITDLIESFALIGEYMSIVDAVRSWFDLPSQSGKILRAVINLCAIDEALDVFLSSSCGKCPRGILLSAGA